MVCYFFLSFFLFSFSILISFRNDAKTVNVISLGVFHKSAQIATTALHFFLGVDLMEEEVSKDELPEDPHANLKDISKRYSIGKKTRHREKLLEKAKTKV